MNIGIARTIDRYAGPLVCRAVLGARRFVCAPAKPAGEQGARVEEIVVIKYFGMGSILLASPAIMALKKRYPSARVTILTLDQNNDMCLLLPSIDRTICLDMSSPLRLAYSYVRAIYKCRRLKPDVIFDLEFLTNFSALSTLLVAGPASRALTVGFHSPIRWRNSVYTLCVSFDHSRHISRIFCKMAGAVGGPIADADVSFAPERLRLLGLADRSTVQSIRAQFPALHPRANLVCLNVNAGVLTLHRRWPLPYFRAVVGGLVQREDVITVLIGGTDDRDYVAALCGQFPGAQRICNVCGKTSIRQLVGLLAESRLLVTNDSGPLHVAHVIGTPTVSLFGPETPYLYGPVGEGHHVFYRDLYCSPCINIYESKYSACARNICLEQIDPREVLRVIFTKYLPAGDPAGASPLLPGVLAQ